jgi:hypothetical protein
MNPIHYRKIIHPFANNVKHERQIETLEGLCGQLVKHKPVACALVKHRPSICK